MLYQYQQETYGVRSNGESRADRADKEIDGTLKIGSSILNHERSHGQNKSRNPQDCIPRYCPHQTWQKISHILTQSRSMRKEDIYVSNSRTMCAKDKPYTFAKSAQCAQKPYTNVRKIRMRTQKPYTNVRKIRKTYANYTQISGLNQLLTYNIHKQITGLNQLVK